MNAQLPKVLLVGPLPPPAGGMANQTRQLACLLTAEGVQVELLQSNAPYRPAWVGRLRGLRAVARLVPYLLRMFRAAGRADVVHVMANSGWSWHLIAAPAIWMATLRGTPVVVNYRGGLAAEFLDRQGRVVKRTLSRAAALVVPSRFLQEVFAQHGVTAEIIPNVVDTSLFRPGAQHGREVGTTPHIVVARNLERIYGNDVAIRAFTRLKQQFPGARLSVAGTGPEAGALRALAADLGVAEAVTFTGRLGPSHMAALYQSADVVMNPSRVDNTPNSILEALACGVPVVSTDVGGVPFLIEHGRTAWLVRPDDPETMAAGITIVLTDAALSHNLRENGRLLANACTWGVVGVQWLNLYRRLCESQRVARGAANPVH